VCCLIRRLNGSLTWACSLLVLAVSYGYIFRFGFLNFYLSTGLSALAVAAWGKHPWRKVLSGLSLAVAAIGNPMPPGYVLACLLYCQVIKRMPEDLVRPALFCCVVWFASLGRAVPRILHAAWSPEQVIGSNAPIRLFGFDQLWVYGSEYRILAWMTFCVAVVGVVTRIRDIYKYLQQPLIHLLLLNAVVIAMFPDAIQTSEAAAPISFITDRVSLFSCIIVCVLVARLPNRHWQQFAYGAAAIVFFLLTLRQDVQLSVITRELETAVDAIPHQSRVLALITTPELRLNPLGHAIDRACMGHCFSFGNYEPASKHFRLKAVTENPITFASPAEIAQLEHGSYTVKQDDTPTYAVCSCENATTMCAVELKVGQRICELRIDRRRNHAN
jgi:hypothetical protein